MNLAGFDSKSFLATLSEAPGVYRMLAVDGAVLYVGKAKNLKRRLSSYFQKSDLSPRIRLMLEQVAGIEVSVTRSEAEALILENTLIKRLKPKYNILFRDDKSYPYIALSGGDFPRLFYYRGAFEKRNRYYGPFPSALAAREAIERVQKTFLLRTCEETVFAHRSRPCLLHQIHRCKAPCVGLVSPEEYAQDVRRAELFLSGRHGEVIEELRRQMEAEAKRLRFEQAAAIRDQIRALQKVLHRQYVSAPGAGDVDIVVAVSEGGMSCVNLAMVRGGLHLGDRAFFPEGGEEADAAEALAAFLGQHYADNPPPARILASAWPEEEERMGLPLVQPRSEMERAWLEMAEKNAHLALKLRLQAGARATARLAALQEALALPEPPRRIECFDVSHTMGEGTVASCVVCVDGQMKKGEYRRYNVAGVTPGDDYAALRQILTRRYSRLAQSAEAGGNDESMTRLPDLILIDGGKGQHAVAREVLAELGLAAIPSLGIAKGEERKPGTETLFPPDREEPLELASTDPAFHLLQQIRDEAHRFAIAGHRARREKRRRASVLDEIPGIGPARRRALLAHFGGLAGVKAATVEDLCRVKGISRELAALVHACLHSQ